LDDKNGRLCIDKNGRLKLVKEFGREGKGKLLEKMK